MKMVIVFDTEDPQGMKDTYRMIMYLAQQHMNLDDARRAELTKIQLIKALKDFSRENLSGKLEKPPRLPELMEFADKILQKYGVPQISDEKD